MGTLTGSRSASRTTSARGSVVHAQFNAAYTFARALTDARVDLRSFQKPAISDPAIVALAAKVRAVDDPAIDPTAIEPARVTVTLNDGRVVEVKSDTVKGSPQEPMSEDELLAKFRDCLDFGVGAKRADADRLADANHAHRQLNRRRRTLVGAFPQTTPSNRG